MIKLIPWVDIPEFDRFKANRNGEVISLKNGKIHHMQKKLVGGFNTVYLSYDRDTKRRVYIHDLVAIMFIENPYNFKYVIHKDGNKINNRAENLIWSPYPNKLEGQWKKMDNFSDYLISEDGDVKSFKTRNFLSMIYQNYVSGYKSIYIYNDDGNRISYYAHELVGSAFIPNPNNYKYVTHIDGNVKNNNVKNLKWTETREEQVEENEDEWKIFPDYPGYKFLKTGKIKSTKQVHQKLLKPTTFFDGYPRLNLYNEEGRRMFSMHRIIATLFVPNPDNLPIVDHIDRNRRNYNASNLRWVTSKQNSENIDEEYIPPASRPIYKCDLSHNTLEKYNSASEASRQNPGISLDTIRKIANGKTTKVKDFIWVWEKDKTVEKYIKKEGEIFKQIIGDFDGYELKFPNYFVSNFGNVINKEDLKLKYRNTSGYPMATLSHKSKYSIFSVHRLVALFFIDGRTKERCIVNHLDENKENAHFSNLEWCTYEENSFHSRYKNAMAVKQIDPETNEVVAIYKSQKDAYKALNKSWSSSISSVIHGFHNLAYGYKWERVVDMNE